MHPRGRGRLGLHLVATASDVEHEGVGEQGKRGLRFGCKLVLAKRGGEARVTDSGEVVTVPAWRVRVLG